MKHVLHQFFLCSLLLVCGWTNVQAQAIASWNFAGEPGDQVFTEGIGSANVEALNFSRGADINQHAAANSISSTGWDSGEARYFTFGFVIGEGFVANLISLQLGTRSSNTGPGELALRSSLDGFTENLATWTQSGTNFNNQTIDLTSLSGISGEVEFRIITTSNVSAGGGAVGSGGTFRVTNFFPDNIAVTFNGEVLTEGGETPGTPPLAMWDFAGEPGSQVSTSGTSIANISAIDFTRGPGLSSTSANNSISSSGWSTDSSVDYFSFGFEVNEGFEANLETLIIASRSSGTGPGDLTLRYSVDNFEKNLATWTQSGTAFNNQTIDLSILSGLTGKVEFRIVTLSARSANNGTLADGGTFRIANFLESGETTPVQFTGTITESIPPTPVTLSNWNFNGLPGNQEVTPGTTSEEGITVADFSRGSSLNPASANNSMSSNGWNAGDNRYFSFGFTVAPDKLVDLTTLQIGTRSSGTGPRDMALQYSGDNFESNLATWVSENNFLNQTIDLSALQNLAGSIEFRIVSLSDVSASGGTVGSGGTFRVTNFFPDNEGTALLGFVKQAEGVILPRLTAEPNAIEFGVVTINDEASIMSYMLNGENLLGPVTVSATAPFGVSKDGETFNESIVFTSEEIQSGQAVFVRFDNGSEGSFSSSIVNQTEGSAPVSVTVNAVAQDPFNVGEDFNSSCPDGLPIGWTSVSVLGAQEWACTTFGRAGTSPTASSPFGLQMNGFSSGAQLNEDWLITPAFDLTDFNFPLLSIWSRVAFNGPRLRMLVSTDYETGDPTAATWIELSDRFATGDVWTDSGEIDLSKFKSAGVRIAFVYNSSPEAGAARWTLDDFVLRSSDTPPAPFLSQNIGNVDYFHFGVIPVGSTSEETKTFNFSLGNAIADLTISSGEGFEFSKDGENFSPVLTYSPSESGDNNTVTIRFVPNSVGAFSGPVTFKSGDILLRRGFLTGATIEKSKTFDVVTWNIEWFGSTEPRQGPNNVDLQLQNVKTIIEALDADVYAFQEITSEQKFNELVEALPGYEGFVSPAVSRGPEFFDEAQKLTFLYKKETITPIKTRVLLEGVQESDLIDYPSTPDRFWASGRLPFLMEVSANIDGLQQNFNIINIHARSNGGGESVGTPRYAMRRYDVNVLKDSLDQYYGNVPLILLGDYNDDLDETVANQTAPTVNTDETSFINFINDTENYIPVTLTLSNAGLRTFPSFENVIDHMIISDELEENWIRNSERVVAPFDLVTNYLNTTSDHIPVKTRFTLRCDIVLAEIIGTDEVCSGENEVDLMLIGGFYETIEAWEISTDSGETWEILEGKAGLSEITLSNLEESVWVRATISSNLCGPEATAPFEVTVVKLPEPVVYFERGQLMTIDGPYSYTWFKDGQQIAQTTQPSIRIQGEGLYRVTIRDAKGCESTSDGFSFPKDGIGNNVRIMPNPASDRVRIELNKLEGLSNIELRNAFGSKISGTLTREGVADFDLNGLAKGVYLIVVTTQAGEYWIERLIIK